MNGQPNDATKRRFAWGMLLGWSPIIFVMGMVIANVFKEISSTKATGLGAVAGGLQEGLASFGLVVTVAFEVSAIVLLVRSFSKGHSGRAMLAVVSILRGGLMLSFLGAFLWLSFYHFRLNR